ncbi:MAG: asparaginase domain-containing protein [Candidatus Woesearchaeota archaeon]
MAGKKSIIHIVLTGGTIDSFYDGTKDTAVTLKHSSVPNYLKSLHLYEKLLFTEVCMKDSRDLTLKDRKDILKTIKDSSSSKIIITHGTYTMPDTSRYLKANLGKIDKTIVFTGSLIPLTGFSPSDASFNLGYSIAKVQELDKGIYVCMNGKVFSPEEVAKLIYEGRFISIFGERGK